MTQLITETVPLFSLRVRLH